MYGSSAFTGKNRLLIVEDDGLNQVIYKVILSKDYDVTVCSDEEGFYAALKDSEFELFIIDLSLHSAKNGIDLIKELREMSRYKKTPIIVVTAFVQQKDKENALDAGGTVFISKPFQKGALLNEINKYF